MVWLSGFFRKVKINRRIPLNMSSVPTPIPANLIGWQSLQCQSAWAYSDGLTLKAHIFVRWCIEDVTTALHSSTCRTRRVGHFHQSPQYCWTLCCADGAKARTWPPISFQCRIVERLKICVSLLCSFMYTFWHYGAWGNTFAIVACQTTV